jgi:hypothetical protein
VLHDKQQVLAEAFLDRHTNRPTVTVNWCGHFRVLFGLVGPFHQAWCHRVIPMLPHDNVLVLSVMFPDLGKPL